MPRLLLMLLMAMSWVWLGPAGAATAQNKTELARIRNEMVDEEIVAAGVKNKRVIASLRKTPRHEFVPLVQRKRAYLDMALPIGEQQTISPPFIVAYMTEQIDPQPSDRVLEIGTGSGYQAAVLSPLVREVYSIEIVGPLGRRAERTLKRLKYDNVHTKVGDGYLGWPEHAPFNKIIVTCSPEAPPKPLVEQLAEGGLMIIPVGERYRQNLVLMRKIDGKLERQVLQATLFVPMTGAAEKRRRVQPDPANPSLTNGGFEQTYKRDGQLRPEDWYYLRRMTVVTDEQTAPRGRRYLRFNNEEPGLGCRALQGFSIDGREVASLRVRFSVRGSKIRYGQSVRQWPYLVITFYDNRRNTVGEQSIGPFIGDFPWTKYDEVLRVPLKSREAIIRIGLLGAIGEIAYDDLQVSPAAGR